MAQRLLQIIEANGKSYEIKAVMNRYPDSDENTILRLKFNTGYDALIKNDKFYFLCNEIIEAQFTELKNDIIADVINDTIKNIETN